MPGRRAARQVHAAEPGGAGAGRHRGVPERRPEDLRQHRLDRQAARADQGLHYFEDSRQERDTAADLLADWVAAKR
ncbi:hypothetical protein [Phenylobacterium sp. J367]|uniref:hypothetical protein n=1 Tax=Phenylobacterium sp. J367 TaxID=2898435 RepID=UPI0035AF70F1